MRRSALPDLDSAERPRPALTVRRRPRTCSAHGATPDAGSSTDEPACSTHRPPAAEKRGRAARARSRRGALLRFPGAFSPARRAWLVERHRLRRRLRLGRRARGRPRSARHRPDHADRGRRPRRADRPRDRPAGAHRRRHRLRRADERGPHRSRRSRTPGWPAATSRTRSTPSAAAISTARPSSPRTWRCKRIRAAVAARRDPNFLICARTDVRAAEGLDAAIDRARRYVDAGADLIFPEALRRRCRVRGVPRGRRRPAAGQHDRVRQVRALHDAAAARRRLQRRDLPGHRRCAWPWAPSRRGLREIAAARARTAELVRACRHRARLYELLGYADYNRFDADVFNFVPLDRPDSGASHRARPTAPDDPQGPRRSRRRHHRDLQRRPRDQLA